MENCPELETTEIIETLPDPKVPKRIVLMHRTGVMAGMCQITSMEDAEGIPQPLPTFVPDIERPLDGDVINASMVRVKRGAIYYNELIVPVGMKRFNESQI